MNGLEATAEIRKREAQTGKHIPIIAVTANSMKGDRERFIAGGMDNYLSKPLDIGLMNSMLKQYLSRK